MMANYEQQRRLFDGSRRRQVQQHSHPPPQHLVCPQPHYGGPASGTWCGRCGRAGNEAKMCAARKPRMFNELCGTCSELGHLSCHCFLQRDRIHSNVLTLSSPPQINRSGRGGTGYDIPWSPPQYTGSNNGYGTNKGPQQQYGRGADGSAGYGATFAQQQPAPRPFRSFGWDQRYACRNGPPVNGGLSNSFAQGQAQRDVGMDDQEDGQRPSTEVECHGGSLSEVFGPPESVEQQRATTEIECHGGPVPEVSGPPEATASLPRGGLPLQARDQRRLQPPSGTLSPPTAVISDSAFQEWLQSDNMEMPMFSLSEGPQQSAPTAVALAAAAPATEAMTGIRAFPTVSSKGVAESPASSAGAVSAAVPVAYGHSPGPLKHAPFPLVLDCSHSQVGIDTESSEVVQKTPHPLFFLSFHAARALHQFFEHHPLRPSRVLHARHKSREEDPPPV